MQQVHTVTVSIYNHNNGHFTTFINTTNGAGSTDRMVTNINKQARIIAALMALSETKHVYHNITTEHINANTIHTTYTFMRVVW